MYTCECHAQENFAITIEIYGMNIEEEKKLSQFVNQLPPPPPTLREKKKGKLKNQEKFNTKNKPRKFYNPLRNKSFNSTPTNDERKFFFLYPKG